MKDYLNLAIWVLIIACVGLFLSPIILTSPAVSARWDFSTKGPVGDTIGGLTSPVINLASVILLYLALRAQIINNRQTQWENITNKEYTEIEQLYINVKESIDNFSFQSLDIFNSHGKRSHGSEAIYLLFNEVYCHQCKLNEEDIKSNPKLSELASILELLNYTLNRLQDSQIENKQSLEVLLKHQFIYRIYPKLKEVGFESLAQHFCQSCNCEHGLPNNFLPIVKDLISKIIPEDVKVKASIAATEVNEQSQTN